jgi:hypothetical protein
MTGRSYQEEASRRDREDRRADREDRTQRTEQADRDDRDDRTGGTDREKDGRRRVVDDSVPAPGGLTSPGKGMDEEPVEPGQSKDYT